MPSCCSSVAGLPYGADPLAYVYGAKEFEKKFKSKKGVLLDIGCGANKQRGFVGMDKRALPGVDVVHDLEVFPYPIPDESCLTIKGSHIVEHLKPWLMIDFMNELWRIMKTDGQLALSMPYGVNHLFVQDPTHCNPCNERTWQYFDPDYPLWGIYTPKPWEIESGFPVYKSDGCLEVVMRKRPIPEVQK